MNAWGRRVLELCETLVPNACDEATERWTRRWLWAGWGTTVLLGFLSPWRRAILLTPGSGSPPVYAAVGVMVVVLLLARRRPQALFSALLMSAGAIGIGGSLAFGSLFALTHRPLQAVLAAKWLILGVALTFLFIRQMRRAVMPPPGYAFPSLEGLTREEALRRLATSREEIRAESERLRGRSNRLILVGGALCLAGLAVMVLLSSHRLSPTQESFVLAFAGAMLLASGAGAWRAFR